MSRDRYPPGGACDVRGAHDHLARSRRDGCVPGVFVRAGRTRPASAERPRGEDKRGNAAMTYTSDLARYVAETRYEDLPAPVVTAAKRITLDLFGVAIAAVKNRPAGLLADYLEHLGGREQATVMGAGIRTNTVNAALMNGVLAAELEQDDVHATGSHPSSVYVPALLALAEDIGASGREWINALVAAYDVGIRLSVAMDNVQMYSRGFHPTSVCGCIGAAAAGARLLGLTAEETTYTIGLAGCQASGLLTWEGESEHFTKSFQSGAPARNAVTAAQLAARGYVCNADTLDGEFNVFDSFSTRRDFPTLTRDLGSRYEILNTTYKVYSCCRAIHAPLDIVFDLMEEQKMSVENLESMDVWLTPDLRPTVDNRVLSTHNLQHVVAAAITDGIVTRRQTSDQRRGDPALVELARRVHLSDDSGLVERHPEMGWIGPTRVVAHLPAGRP